MKMKKTLIVLMIVAMMLAVFAGCGSGGDGDNSGDGDGDYMLEVLRVGFKNDVPGFGYLNPETNEIEGFEVDLAKALAKELTGSEENYTATEVNANTRGPMLDNGELDCIIATFTITEERKELFNFSDAYFTDHVGLLVKKDSGIESFADLDGKTIGVAQSATSRTAIQEAADEAGISVSFSEFGTYPEIKTALVSGRVDCFSVDKAILLGYLDDDTVILPEDFRAQDYGIATKKDNTELADKINEILLNMQANGELDALKAKWGIDAL